MYSALYVRRFNLNLIRDLIGNQCSDLSRGLDSESLLDLVTTRARQFCTQLKTVLYLLRRKMCIFVYHQHKGDA